MPIFFFSKEREHPVHHFLKIKTYSSIQKLCENEITKTESKKSKMRSPIFFKSNYIIKNIIAICHIHFEHEY